MATSAPLERRAVVAGHAIRATDADWEFGRGPVLEGTQLEIVRFLLGLSDVAPHRPIAQADRLAGRLSRRSRTPMRPETTM